MSRLFFGFFLIHGSTARSVCRGGQYLKLAKYTNSPTHVRFTIHPHGPRRDNSQLAHRGPRVREYELRKVTIATEANLAIKSKFSRIFEMSGFGPRTTRNDMRPRNNSKFSSNCPDNFKISRKFGRVFNNCRSFRSIQTYREECSPGG